jgi:DNA-binding XRE family transcriptional regulator
MRKARRANLPNRLRLLRVEFDVKQIDVAIAIGVPQTRIHLIETGKAEPTRGERERLIKFFGLGESDIFSPVVAA